MHVFRCCLSQVVRKQVWYKLPSKVKVAAYIYDPEADLIVETRLKR